MHKEDLALNNLQRLICYKTKPTEHIYAESCLYIYIKYIWFVNSFFEIFLNEPKLILLYNVKWFQVFLSNTNISI